MDYNDDPYYVDLPPPRAAKQRGSSITDNTLLASADIFFDVLRKQQRQLELLTDAVRLQQAARANKWQQAPIPQQAAIISLPPPPVMVTHSPPLPAQEDSSARRARGPHKPLADMFAEAPVRAFRSTYHPSPPRLIAPRKPLVSGGGKRRVGSGSKRALPSNTPALIRKKRVAPPVRTPKPAPVKRRSLPPPPPLLEVDDGRVLSHKERIERLRQRWRTEQVYRAEGEPLEELLQVDVTGSRLRQSSIVGESSPHHHHDSLMSTAGKHRRESDHVEDDGVRQGPTTTAAGSSPASLVAAADERSSVRSKGTEPPRSSPEVVVESTTHHAHPTPAASIKPSHLLHVPQAQPHLPSPSMTSIRPSPRPASSSPSRRGTDEESAKIAEKLFLDRLKLEEESPARRHRRTNNKTSQRSSLDD